jgi:hypothetical protein
MFFRYNLWWDMRQKAENAASPRSPTTIWSVVERMLREQLTSAQEPPESDAGSRRGHARRSGSL